MPESRGDGQGDAAERRRAHVASLISSEPGVATDGDGVVGSLERLCRALVAHLSLLGVAVHLMTEAGSQGVAAGSDRWSVRVDEIQFSLGEGPGLDAYNGARPVLVTDVEETIGRWPGYAQSMSREGVRAVSVYPLQIGASRFGVLTLYGADSGSLSDDDKGMAATFAHVASGLMVGGEATANKGDLGPELDIALSYRSQVYQAQGIVMSAAGVGLVDALALMRAHAYATGRSIADLADDIVAGRTKLGRDDG